jgi:hypothetical protein
MARLAADQDATHWPRITYARGKIAARTLCWSEIRQVGTVAFPGVHDHDPGGTACLQDAAGGGDGGAQQGHIIAEGGAEAAWFKEVTLHVDDHQRSGGGIEPEWVWFSVDLRHACFLGIERLEGADFVAG